MVFISDIVFDNELDSESNLNDLPIVKICKRKKVSDCRQSVFLKFFIVN